MGELCLGMVVMTLAHSVRQLAVWLLLLVTWTSADQYITFSCSLLDNAATHEVRALRWTVRPVPNIVTVEKACGLCWQFFYTDYGLKLKVAPDGAGCGSCMVDLSGKEPSPYPDSAQYRCAGFHRFEDHVSPWTDYLATDAQGRQLHTQMQSPLNNTFQLVYDYEEYLKTQELNLPYNDFIGNFTISHYHRTTEGIAAMPNIATVPSINVLGRTTVFTATAGSSCLSPWLLICFVLPMLLIQQL